MTNESTRDNRSRGLPDRLLEWLLGKVSAPRWLFLLLAVGLMPAFHNNTAWTIHFTALAVLVVIAWYDILVRRR